MKRLVGVGIWVIIAFSPEALGEWVKPRHSAQKPVKTLIEPYHRRDAIFVKFRDDLPIRAVQGALVDRDARSLNAAARATIARFAGGNWVHEYPLHEDKLEQLRQTARHNLARAVADLRTQFVFKLPVGVDPAAAIDAFNALDIVEIAEPAPLPMPLPLPPNYQSNQGYLGNATAGITATTMWNAPYNTTGAGVKITDIEYSWNLAHQDLPTVSFIAGPTPVDPFSDTNHGTAVLGELGAISNGWGTTGSAHGSSLYVAAANTTNGYDVGAAILRAVNVLGPGDLILIEQQTAGPNYTGSPPGTQFGLIPVEWVQSWYNAIVTAVGNNITVVEAAGNGSQNLDDAIYGTGHGGHWPFLPQNDSGAIIVGAGGSPTGGSGDRSRLSFSCYGSTVDLQGWGENVFTTGYGNAYSSEGVNLYYTASFSGTSSASPIVTGACALLQSYFKSSNPGNVLTPAQIKTALQATGSPQLNGVNPATQNIGPRPNVAAAANTLAGETNPPAPDPMTFSAAPAPIDTSSITMTATAATDASPPIEYKFECTSVTPGGTSSLWQSMLIYTDTGLTANTLYSYRVAARDNRPTPNQTAFSDVSNAATMIETPLGLSQGILGYDTVELVAQGTFTNLNVGQSALWFESTTPGGNGGLQIWTQNDTVTATGLTPDTDYEFQVKARNQDGVETAFGPPMSVRTYYLPGDCNNDLDFTVESDLDCIVDAMLGQETSPPGGAHRIDLNYDEITDGQDLQLIIDCLRFGGC